MNKCFDIDAIQAVVRGDINYFRDTTTQICNFQGVVETALQTRQKEFLLWWKSVHGTPSTATLSASLWKLMRNPDIEFFDWLREQEIFSDVFLSSGEMETMALDSVLSSQKVCEVLQWINRHTGKIHPNAIQTILRGAMLSNVFETMLETMQICWTEFLPFALKNCTLNVLQWVFSHCDQSDLDVDMFAIASQRAAPVETLNWIYGLNRFPVQHISFYCPQCFDSLETLSWFLAHSYSPGDLYSEVLCHKALNDSPSSLALFECLNACGVALPGHYDPVKTAIRLSRYDELQWLFHHGCKMPQGKWYGDWSYMSADEIRNLEILSKLFHSVKYLAFLNGLVVPEDDVSSLQYVVQHLPGYAVFREIMVCRQDLWSPGWLKRWQDYLTREIFPTLNIMSCQTQDVWAWC